MSTSSIGPIDVALLEFPEHTPTGEVAAELVAATDAGAIALYDVIAVRKRVDGTVEGFELSELDGGEFAMSVFAGAQSGLLGEDDVAEAGSVLVPGSIAVVLVYENTWAAPLTTAVHRAGGELTASLRIPAQAVSDQLDALESAL
ncbi:MAG TPA: DUF6325 family protein [Acidimicrobiia bacterium]|nr:DUF6325 family protein [Acidimicrobiia bacterium]